MAAATITASTAAVTALNFLRSRARSLSERSSVDLTTNDILKAQFGDCHLRLADTELDCPPEELMRWRVYCPV